MPSYSKRSADALATAHPDLQRLFREVLKGYDHAILIGHRPKLEQDAAVAAGHSQTPWPKSKHNREPSLAVDAAPYPIVWPEAEKTKRGQALALARFYHFAGYVLGIAVQIGVAVRWGGDWDSDADFADQRFDDLPHFELLNPGVSE